MFEMKDEYLVGIDFVDTQHSKLFEIADRAYQLNKDPFIVDKYDQIVEILDELKEYTIMHFSEEEVYMESIGYKKLFSHKIEHKEFIEKLNNANLEYIDENQDEALLKILTFLNDWLVDHILHTDKLVGLEAN